MANRKRRGRSRGNAGRLQPVRVTQIPAGTSDIDNGLDAGTPIVTAGQYRLQPGSLVQSTDAVTDVASGK